MVRFAVAGPAGSVTQTDQPVWTTYIDALGMVVDEWVMREHSPEHRWCHMSVIGYTRREDGFQKPCYAVAVYTVDPDAAALMREFRVPRALASSLLLIAPIEVATVELARRVGHKLAHNVAQGTIPMCPRAPEEVAAWHASTRVIVLAVVPQAGHQLPPLGVTQSSS